MKYFTINFIKIRENGIGVLDIYFEKDRFYKSQSTLSLNKNNSNIDNV